MHGTPQEAIMKTYSSRITWNNWDPLYKNETYYHSVIINCIIFLYRHRRFEVTVFLTGLLLSCHGHEKVFFVEDTGDLLLPRLELLPGHGRSRHLHLQFRNQEPVSWFHASQESGKRALFALAG
jgi:hypothetical protein